MSVDRVRQILEAVPEVPKRIFFDSSGLIVPVLAEEVTGGTTIRLGHDGSLYRYERGVYRSDGDAFVRSRCREVLGERFRRRHVDEVVSYLRSEFPSLGEHPPAGLLNVRNGLLNLRTLALQPHDPAVPSTVQLPVEWDPTATCPAIRKFLEDVIPKDAVELVEEIVGYVTYPANPYRVAVLLLGPGRNGKSVLLKVIQSLIGPANCASMPLQTMAENRFALAELFGKLANICGDLDARAVRRSDGFKMLTGGDTVFAERKYGHPFSFTPYALPLFSANEPPVSSDQTDAWFDRWILVPLERRFTEEEADPFLTGRLTTQPELSGLLVVAVHALRRLLLRGRFDRPKSVVNAGEAYRDKLDTVRGFVAEECVVDPSAWVPRSKLYQSYRRWCQGSGRLPVSAERFNDHVRSSYPMRVSESTRRGNRGWQGVGLLSDRENEETL